MMVKRFCLFSFIFIFVFVSVSCRRSIGYSVLLWDIPEKNLQDGQIVKVYFKSNISQVYVIGLPDTNENFEVPLWQLTTPQSKSKTQTASQRYKEYQHQYARVKTDGLPVRAEAVNTSKQVYRLHKNEVLKILYKGKGQDVIMGDGSKLQGDWLHVLTTGGTQGWCFSNNLAIFETGAGGQVVRGEVEEDEAEDSDTMLTQVLQTKWYPESYTRMLSDDMIDLETMKSGYGFDTGAESGKVTINIKDRFRTANYGGITKVRDKVYDFTGTPFQMIIHTPDEIVVNYSNNERPESYTFVTISGDYNIEQIVMDEQERRAREMQKLYDVDSFYSMHYGLLTFTGLTTFTWARSDLLSPDIISIDVERRGRVSIKYLISDELKDRFDGMLTFNFENADRETNFFYKYSNSGLTLEYAGDAIIRNNIATARGRDNPTTIFLGR